MHLTMFPECQSGNHKDCPRSYSCPPGQFGGSRCTCNCHIEQVTPVYFPPDLLEAIKAESELTKLREQLTTTQAKLAKAIRALKAVLDGDASYMRHELDSALRLASTTLAEIEKR
jgi:hypothetical protein